MIDRKFLIVRNPYNRNASLKKCLNMNFSVRKIYQLFLKQHTIIKSIDI